jgi:nicotinate dehydrogenase subunit B
VIAGVSDAVFPWRNPVFVRFCRSRLRLRKSIFWYLVTLILTTFVLLLTYIVSTNSGIPPEAASIGYRDEHSNDFAEIRVPDGRSLIVKRARYAWAAPRFATSRLASTLIRERTDCEAPEPIEPAADWTQAARLPAGDLREYLMANETAAFPLDGGMPIEAPVPDPVRPPDTRAIVAEYFRPYVMHASLAPSAAMARFDGERLTVWSHSQGIEILRGCLAKALGIDVGHVTVLHTQGAGAYGHNGADDVALDAALCARAMPGHPILLKWTRPQEHQWEPYGPAARFRLEAALDDEGRIRSWSHDVWSFSHSGRPMPMREGLDMIAAWHLEQPFPRSTPSPSLGREVGIHRNAWPLYTVREPRVVKRFVRDSPLRTSSLRGLGAHANIFAIESFMDELAEAAGQDPAAFRLRHLDDPRAIAVIEKVVDMAGGGLGRGNGGSDCPRGRGLGFARYKNQQTYAAVIAEIEVDMTTAVVRPIRLWIAADAGRVVDPDGLVNQLEGGAVQSLSWTLKEAVRFDADAVTSIDWETYPILRFSEVPDVVTALIDRPERRSLGAGEATQGPAAGALVNAVYAATGLRVRELPLTPERLRAVAIGGT